MTEQKLVLKWEKVSSTVWFANTPLFPSRVVYYNQLWHVDVPNGVHKTQFKSASPEEAKLHAESEFFRRIDECLKLREAAQPKPDRVTFDNFDPNTLPDDMLPVGWFITADKDVAPWWIFEKQPSFENGIWSVYNSDNFPLNTPGLPDISTITDFSKACWQKTKSCQAQPEPPAKPDPQPWGGIEDVPLDAWFRTKLHNDGFGAAKPTEYSNFPRIYIGREWWTMTELFAKAEWSYDPKTGPWFPCDSEHTKAKVVRL